MPWPQANAFQDAVLNPQASFVDTDLREAEVVCDARGLPIPASGQFGIVYQMRSAKSSWALKCFTSDIPGRADRYRKISEHLRQAKLPFLVGFDYLDQGIYVGGQWFPVLKMDWVEGQTLNKFVAERVDQPKVLSTLVDLWVRLTADLRAASVVHADLQHGNVMLVPTQERRVKVLLVDYDGMYLPSLAGTNSGECGHPAYQHPQRLTQGLYGPEVDRFSQLVIYTALRALLAHGREFWKRYDNGENLLFTQADFKAVRNSKVLKELWNDEVEDIRSLTGRLILATATSLEQTPLLEALLRGPQIERLSLEQVSEVEWLVHGRRSSIALKEEPVSPPARTTLPPPVLPPPVPLHEQRPSGKPERRTSKTSRTDPADEEAPAIDLEERDEARKTVEQAANFLMWSGLISFVVNCFIIVVYLVTSRGSSVGPTLWFLVTLAAGSVLALVGGQNMMNLQNHRLALAGAVAIIPAAFGLFLIGVPVGVWCLMVLVRPEVKTWFDEE